MERYGELLKSRKAKLGIWGLGHIGYSTMLHFADLGVQCIGYDIDQDKLSIIKKGEIPISGLKNHVKINPSLLVQKGLINVTNDPSILLKNNDVLVHCIAVPTEKGGEPWWDILKQTVAYIAKNINKGFSPSPLIIIESTITSGITDDLIIPILNQENLKLEKDILYGISPRRDWFSGEEFSLKSLNRVYSGYDDYSADQVHSVLSLVCENLFKASNYRVGELVKAVENAFRHVSITLANQLSLAFPNINIREVLALAGTKWNLETYHPSFGTGGYCIPLSSRYVLQKAENPKALSLLTESIKTDDTVRISAAESIKNYGCKNVGIMGISYKGNLKVSILSPALFVAKYLLENGINVSIYDPYYSPEEIESLTGAKTFEYPEDLNKFDGLVVVTDHLEFTNQVNKGLIIKKLQEKKLLILDNYGIWKDWPWPEEIDYYAAGEAGLYSKRDQQHGKAAA